MPTADATAKAPAWLNDRTLYHNRGDSTFAGESSEYGDFVGLDDPAPGMPRSLFSSDEIKATARGVIDQQVRVIGEASKPQSLTWRPNMTLLDVLVAVEGLTEFADGNGAMLVRKQGEETLRYRVRVADLLQEGDVGANAELLPGDVLIIPEAVF